MSKAIKSEPSSVPTNVHSSVSTSVHSSVPTSVHSSMPTNVHSSVEHNHNKLMTIYSDKIYKSFRRDEWNKCSKEEKFDVLLHILNNLKIVTTSYGCNPYFITNTICQTCGYTNHTSNFCITGFCLTCFRFHSNPNIVCRKKMFTLSNVITNDNKLSGSKRGSNCIDNENSLNSKRNRNIDCSYNSTTNADTNINRSSNRFSSSSSSNDAINNINGSSSSSSSNDAIRNINSSSSSSSSTDAISNINGSSSSSSSTDAISNVYSTINKYKKNYTKHMNLLNEMNKINMLNDKLHIDLVESIKTSKDLSEHIDNITNNIFANNVLYTSLLHEWKND